MSDKVDLSPELNEKMTQLVLDLEKKIEDALPGDVSAQMSVLLVSYLKIGITSGMPIEAIRAVINVTLDMVGPNMESIIKNSGPTLLN